MTRGACTIDGCDRPERARGFCGMHYNRWYRHDNGRAVVKPFVRGDDAARFASHVEVQENGCHLWTGARDPNGYGAFRFGVSRGQKMGRAHIWAWEQANGRPVPEGLVLDHFACDNPSCVNPDHVRPTTNRENILRGTGLASSNLAKTHCVRGHEFTETNTLVSRGSRYCRTCLAVRHVRQTERRRGQAS